MNAIATPESRAVPLEVAVDLRLTLSELALGRRDPSMRFLDDGRILRCSLSPDGPVTLELRPSSDRVVAYAWGPGNRWALERIPALLGLHDSPETFDPEHPGLRDLIHRNPGLRLPTIWGVSSLLWPIVLGQLVTGPEASRSYLRLAQTYGEPAPGPHELLLPPEPRVLARLPWHRYAAAGTSRRQGQTVARLNMVPRRLEESASMNATDCEARLRAIEGIGPWTANSAMLRGMGFADAVPTGDYHLPNTVAWFFAGEPRADDDRMLELLEPYRGHRGRVIRLLMLSGVGAPKRGPRHPIRWRGR